MFTGLVSHVGVVRAVTEIEQGILVTIAASFTESLSLGDSVAVDGICLTVVSQQSELLSFEISPETLALTTACSWQPGCQVNLELALQAQQRLGGHWVSGNVDTTVTVARIATQGEFHQVDFSAERAADRGLLIPKGSVTINGVSLTVNRLTDDGFSVMLVPHTWQRTNLSQLTVGSAVNIEYDQMAKLVARQVQHYLHSTTS